MRKSVQIGMLVVISVLLSGCIVVSSNKTQTSKEESQKSFQKSVTMVEIDSAEQLVSQSARANIYRAIAQRPNLSSEERVYLTNAVTKNLVSESDKEEILLILINNPLKEIETVVIQETSTEEGKE